MKTFRLVVAVWLTALGLAQGMESTPESVVAQLYAAHDAGKGPFFQSSSRALVDRYLANPLADWIWKDSVNSHKTGEVGALDFDPLYNSQDPSAQNFKISPGKLTGEGAATVLVTFNQFGKKEALQFKMLQNANGWRVVDIRYSPELSLSDLFKG